MAQRLEDLLDIVGSQALETPVAGMGMNLTGTPNINYLQNLANLAQQQQGPVLGPDEFGSYTIPVSDPTYRSGFDYARSIAGGIPMSQVIAPGVSYSPEQPMGYTQAQLNIPRDVERLTPPPILPPTREPDDPSFLGRGIGGVRIPVDRDIKMPPLRDIFGGRRDTSSLENLMNIGKLLSGGINQNAIDRPPIDQRRPMPPPPLPPSELDISGLDLTGYVFDPVTRKMIPNPLGNTDMSGKIPSVPTGRDFSVDRDALIRDIREGIEIPKYEMPDLSQFARLEDIPKIPSREDFLSIAREGIEIPQYQAPDLSGFARLEDIPTFDPSVLKQDILMSIPQQQVPDVSQFVTQEDIQRAISGIDIPTYQAPDLSAYDARIAELEQQLAGLQTPTGGRFSVDQQLPRGLF